MDKLHAMGRLIEGAKEVITDEMFHALKPGQRVWMGVSSSWADSKGDIPFEVGRKSFSKKYNTNSLTLYPIKDGEPVKTGAKWTLYNRSGEVSLAHGDMGAVIKSFRTK